MSLSNRWWYLRMTVRRVGEGNPVGAICYLVWAVRGRCVSLDGFAACAPLVLGDWLNRNEHGGRR